MPLAELYNNCLGLSYFKLADHACQHVESPDRDLRQSFPGCFFVLPAQDFIAEFSVCETVVGQRDKDVLTGLSEFLVVVAEVVSHLEEDVLDVLGSRADRSWPELLEQHAEEVYGGGEDVDDLVVD